MLVASRECGTAASYLGWSRCSRRVLLEILRHGTVKVEEPHGPEVEIVAHWRAVVTLCSSLAQERDPIHQAMTYQLGSVRVLQHSKVTQESLGGLLAALLAAELYTQLVERTATASWSDYHTQRGSNACSRERESERVLFEYVARHTRQLVVVVERYRRLRHGVQVVESEAVVVARRIVRWKVGIGIGEVVVAVGEVVVIRHGCLGLGDGS